MASANFVLHPSPTGRPPRAGTRGRASLNPVLPHSTFRRSYGTGGRPAYRALQRAILRKPGTQAEPAALRPAEREFGLASVDRPHAGAWNQHLERSGGRCESPLATLLIVMRRHERDKGRAIAARISRLSQAEECADTPEAIAPTLRLLVSIAVPGPTWIDGLLMLHQSRMRRGHLARAAVTT